MLEDKIAAARSIGLQVNALERRGADQFRRNIALINAVLETREKHGMGNAFAARALSRATAAAAAFAEANCLLLDCHGHLAADQSEFGVPRLGGDLCPWSMMNEGHTTATSHLSLVS